MTPQSDEAAAAVFDETPLKGPLRVREARQRIAALEQVVRDGEAEGTQLCEAFQAQFPKAPAKIVRYNDRSLTFYRWRQSSARRWGSNKTTAVNLTGDAGQRLLARVPATARQHWLNYERRRVYLNMCLSIAAYELYRLQDWLDALDAIKAIERDGLVAGAPDNNNDYG
ncbi:hypothetical protein [Salinisphaera sp. T31B1]|uniref:hypothetical protein n=1 Tax=Salinisphaera sp. T31B1 TaxID=727963 RepID=UPI003341D83D